MKSYYRHILLPLFIVTLAHTASAQQRTLVDPDEHVMLRYDLNAESVPVPGMEDFGLFHGYFGGWKERRDQPYIYGVWALTSFSQDEPGTVTIHLSNDLGSETQAARLRQTSDTTWTLTLQGTTVIKRAAGRKLVKAPTLYHLVEQKTR